MSNKTVRKSQLGQKKTSRIGSRILALEPRYVFDAAIGAELHHQFDTALTTDMASDRPTISSHEVAAAARVLMQTSDDATTFRIAPDNVSSDRALGDLIADHNQEGTQKEIAFIDSRLADIPTLVKDIPSDVRIVLIDASRDGVAQMVEALRGDNGITAIHILSHGSEGHIELGASVLDEQTMSTVYKSALTSIAANLSADADILVYGCNFGAGVTGARATEMLAELTGADVAASVNVTGGAAGADWTLETSTGVIDERSLAAADWNHELLDIVALDGSKSGIKNTPVTGNLSSQVTAINPPVPVTFTAQTIATAHGSVTIQASGAYTYTPNTGYLGTDSFIFEAAATDPVDGVTQTASAVETITIDPNPGYVINAVNETNAVGYDRTFNGTLVDNVTPSTLGGPITTYTKTSGPSHGTVVLNANGTYTYTPFAGYSGPDSFTFSADDADPNSDAASATVTLNVALPPLVAYDYDSYGVIDAPVTVRPVITEADAGATLTYSAGTSANGSLASNGDGTFTFTPTPGFSGDTSATYTVTDSNGYMSTKTLYFHYSATGIPPLSASPETYTIKQGDTVSQGLQYFETNKNGVAPTYTITHTNPAHGTITNFNPATGSYNYIADPGYLGPDSFSFTVIDQDGQLATSTENINIVKPDLMLDASVKFAPVGVAVTGNLGGETHESAGNTTEKYFIGGTPLVTNGTINTAHGVVTITDAATGAYSWQPNPGFSGVETIDWSVKNFWGPGANDFYDGKSSTDTIVSPNKIFAGHRGYAIPENSTKTGTVKDFSGSPAGVAAYTPTFSAAHGIATVNADGTYSYTPTTGYHGVDKFGYKISNGLGNTATGYVTIYIAGPLVPGDNPPVALAIPDQVHLDKDAPVGISVASSFTDPDAGDTLTFIADGLPPGLTMLPNGTITGTIDKSASQGGDFQDGRYTVTVFADDGKGGVAQQTFSWTVTNPPPVANTETISTPYNTPVVVDLLNNDSDPDGDTLTVTGASVDPSEGTVAFNGTDWVFSPAASFKGTATVTYSISDGEGGTATSTHKIIVAAPPIVAVNDSYTTPFNTAVNGTAGTGDTFAPGSTFAKTTNPSNGSVVFNANGTYTYTPTPGFTGTDTFTYTVTDLTGQTSVATETIKVGPGAVNDAYNTPFNTAVNGVAGTADTYLPGSTFAKTTNPSHGSVVFNANGTYTYTPTPGFTGTDTFTYTVTDPSTGLSATATETINVGPKAIDDSYTTPFNTAVNGTAGTADTFAPGSTFAKTTNPSNGSVVFNANGTYTYTPTPGFTGVDTFTYTVTDPATGLTSTATETIKVGPGAVNDSYNTPFNTAVSGNAATADTYLPGSTFAKTTNPSHGTVVFNANGTYTYTPTPGFTGTDTFTYTVTDPSTGLTATATETINVGPKAIDDNYTTPFNTAVNGTAGTADTFAPGSTFAKTTNPSNGSVVFNANGTYIYTPTPGFTGTDTFTYTVTDLTGQTSTATETIKVGPGAVNDSYDTPFNTAVNGNAASGDTVAPGSTFAKTTNPSNGTVVFNANGTYTYTPTPGFTGTDTFTYTVTDPATGLTATATETINVGVKAVNDAYTTPFNTPLAGDAKLADTYPVGSTFAKTTDPTHGSVVFNANGTYTYTPANGFTGTDTFTYTITAPSGQTSTATETIKVGPGAVNDTYSTPFNTPVSGDAKAADTFGAGSTFAKATNPSHGSVVFRPDGTYTYTPTAGFTGTDTFTYTVTDPATGLKATATETINVGPKAISDKYTTPLNTPLAGNAAAGDTYPAGSTFAKTTDPTHGSVVFNANGTYTYTPANGFTGTDSFTYTVTDPATGLTSTATETIQVGLIAANDSYKTPYNTPLAGNAALGDTYFAGSKFSVLTPPAKGTVVMKPDGTYTFKPAAGFSGTVTFTYKITDPSGQTAIATETIVVAPPALKAINHSYQANFDQKLPGNAANGNSFPTGSKFSVLTPPAKGTVTMNADGTYIYVPPKGFTGTTTFKYQIKDPTGAIVTATETITISPKSVIVHCLTTFGNFTGLIKPLPR
jgi:Domain of unknown function (DUF4347)/Cadherin-like domain/Bacterial Ig domain